MSRYVSPREARRRFPTLSPRGPPGAGGIGGSGGTGSGSSGRAEGAPSSPAPPTAAAAASSDSSSSSEQASARPSLKGAIVYSDGQFDDARLCLALAQTAAAAGARVANYAEVTRLMRDEATGKVVGAYVRDALAGPGGKEIPVRAKVVVNAAGPFADEVRRMVGAAADPNDGSKKTKKKKNSSASASPPPPFRKMIQPSSGVHVTLPDYYSPSDTGLIVPKTADGRVVFLLPWHDATIAGTTDAPCAVEALPRATEAEVAFILDAVKPYLTVAVRRSDVQSAWSGVRPLAADPDAEDTASTSRDHVVAVDPRSGLVTVAGGKWTTYRAMAEDVMQKCSYASLIPACGPGVTANLPLIGAGSAGAVQCRISAPAGLHGYGSEQAAVQALPGAQLVLGAGLTEAMVRFAARFEYARTVEDVLARRSRILFLDARLALELAPRVAAILEQETGIDPRLDEFRDLARNYFLV